MIGSAPTSVAGVVRPAVHRSLDTGWTLSCLVARAGAPAGAPIGPLPATVPGYVLDVVGAAGRPTRGTSADADAEADAMWVAASDWRYELALDTTAERRHDHVELVCDGLDTLATVALDDRLVGVTANVHRGYRFDLTDELRAGAQRLTIDLSSTGRHADALRTCDERWPSTAGDARPHVRAMAGATAAAADRSPTTGIHRPVRLHAWSEARLGDLRIEPTLDAHGDGHLEVETAIVASRHLARVLDVTVEHVLTDRSGTVVGSHRSELGLHADRAVVAPASITVRDVRAWWPRSLGHPHRYRLTVRLLADGAELDRWSCDVGFRTVELDTSADAVGSSFRLVVNGVPVFVRGVAWTPGAPLPAAEARAMVRGRLQQAFDAGVDLVRVWGGGTYESDDFYEVCDELGLMVWQDLPFASASYPEELLRDEVRAETRDNVSRLHHHPSLVLWNGNDGCQQGHAAGGWSEVLQQRAWGEGFWTDDVPLVLEELDPSRPYWPGSPFSGPFVAPDADLHGTSHVWTGWASGSSDPVYGRAPRFAAAVGGRAPAVSLAPEVEPAADELDRAVRLRFGTLPTEPEARRLATELVQARVATRAIEHLRSLRGHCAGTVWWQLVDDGTPAEGSLVGRDGRRRLAWYAVRDAYADRLATVQPRGHELVLHLVNDGPTSWWVTGSAERTTLAGAVRIGQPIDVVVAPRSVARLTLDPCVASPRDPADEVLVVEAGGTRAWWWFADDRHLRLPAAPLDLDVQPRTDGSIALVVSSPAVVRDLVLAPELLWPGATTDRQVVSLRPGRPETFVIEGIAGRPVDAAAFVRSPVTWSAATLRADG